MEINKDFMEIREELGLTQLDMAVLLDVSRITYIRWEENPDIMPIGKYESMMNHFERLRKLKED